MLPSGGHRIGYHYVPGLYQLRAVPYPVAAHKFADKAVGRIFEYLLGSAVLEYLPAVEYAYPVGNFYRLVHIVGDKDYGLVQLPLQLHQLILELGTGDGVQGGEGLVHEYDVRVGGKGPGDAYPLLLASGELYGIAVEKLLRVHAHHLHHGQSPALYFLRRHLFQLGHYLYVFLYGHVGEKPRLLYDVADVPPQAYHILLHDIHPVYEDLPRAGLDEPVDHFQGGGLAAARRPYQHYQLPLVYGQVHFLDDHILLVILGDFDKFYQ